MKIIKDNIVFSIILDDGTIAVKDKFYTITYNYLVDKLVRARYSVDHIEAIINNYLLDTTDKDYLKEFNDMQEWRKEAKRIAKKVNDFIQENDLINKSDGVYEIKDEGNL